MTKKLNEISWNVTEDEYRQDPAYSYSTIARFNREGFNKLGTLFEKVESPSLRFGSIVDTLLTGTPEEFEERFMVADLPAVSETLEVIARTIFAKYGTQYSKLEDVPDNILSEEGNEFNFWKGDKYNSRRVSEIRKGCTELYNMLSLGGERTIVRSTEYNDAVDCVNILKTSENTAKFFNQNPFDENVENYYQLKFKGEYEGIPLRCMMDIVQVDYTNKTITPVDLKTSYKREWDFFKSFYEWNYFIQSQLYWEILRQNIEKDPYFKDFTLKDYLFVVISNGSRKPLVWEYLDTKIDYDVCYGKNKQYLCRNWRNIVKELDSYLKNPTDIPHGIYNKENETNDIIFWLNEQ